MELELMPQLPSWSCIIICFVLLSCGSEGTSVDRRSTEDFFLAPRNIAALSGTEFLREIQSLELAEREEAIFKEVTSGNVPDFLRTAVPITFNETLDGSEYEIQVKAMADYLAVGSNEDHVLLPMTPILAQRLLDTLGAILPTRKLVDKIWTHASLKLEPEPIPPSPEMVTIPVFKHHQALVSGQRDTHLSDHPQGELVAGHKKDVILSNRIANQKNKVVIYGWHQANGSPIQPLYSGHVNWYADYSHGIRALVPSCTINDSMVMIHEVLSDSLLYKLLSDEAGPILISRYDTSWSNYP